MSLLTILWCLLGKAKKPNDRKMGDARLFREDTSLDLGVLFPRSVASVVYIVSNADKLLRLVTA